MHKVRIDHLVRTLKRAVESTKYEYVAKNRTETIPELLLPNTLVCVLFSTGWERGRVQGSNMMSISQKKNSKKMKCPFVIKYNDGYWLHDLHDENLYVNEDEFNWMKRGGKNKGEIIATTTRVLPTRLKKDGVWCVVRRKGTKPRVSVAVKQEQNEELQERVKQIEQEQHQKEQQQQQQQQKREQQKEKLNNNSSSSRNINSTLCVEATTPSNKNRRKRSPKRTSIRNLIPKSRSKNRDNDRNKS